ncbi:MAG: hypothetical protein ACF8XB_09855 [Planctomycetota bacterium JB042]
MTAPLALLPPIPLLAAFLASPAPDDAAAPPPPPRTLVLETPPLHIDRIYHSMQGPYDRVPVEAEGLDWVTAIRSEVIDAGDGTRLGDEFFCHSQMQVGLGSQLLVMATGAEEIRFPDGFGVRMTEWTRRGGLNFFGMALNNHVAPIDRHVRVRATVEYRSEEDVRDAPLRELTMTPVVMSVRDARHRPADAHAHAHADARDESNVATHCVLVDDLPVHWMVPPGPPLTRRRIDVRPWLTAERATVHYVATHLHNHGVSMLLRDVTTGEVLWEAVVENEPDRVQIARIPAYASADGFPLRRDHEYEIEARYDNTSDRPIDAMAMMGVYWRPAP